MPVRLRPLVTAGALSLVLAACGGGGADQTIEPSPTADPPAATPSPVEETGVPEPPVPDAGADCSAGELVAEDVEPQGLTDAAAETWSEIRDAALSCDYDRLAGIAGGTEDFTFSFGGGEDPAPFWRRAEGSGQRVLAELVGILELPAAEDDDGAFVWPRAHVEPDDDSAWEELLAVYPPEAIEEWREGGSYLGYRTAIGPEGEWRYFVAGD